jgi:hypothetical protein
VRPLRNIFACLIHEAPDCVLDLVRNLRLLDPSSTVLLYNGGSPDLLGAASTWEQYGAVLHPSPRPMRWGRLHGFALECMAFALAELPFDTLTIVDSDQLLLQRGYSAAIGASLTGLPGIGMLGSTTEPPGRAHTSTPAASALAELSLWRAYLRRFPQGVEQFPRWTMWPATVFTADAARDIVDLWRSDARLQLIVEQSRMHVTEEIVLPTLVALLGHRIVRGPACRSYIRFRERFSWGDLHRALHRADGFWLHPVPRMLNDPLRAAVRAVHGDYGLAADQPPAIPPLPAELPLVSCLMPTYNRRALVPAAVAAFQRQDYPRRELIVLDDGDDPVRDLIPDDGRIIYMRTRERLPLSQKRNLSCATAQGDIFMHWDDDDWQADWRVTYQVAQLLATGADICGTDRLYVYDIRTGQRWLYLHPRDARPLVVNSTLCYTRATWERAPFPPIDRDCETRFQRRTPPDRTLTLPDARFQVALVHGANTARGNFDSFCWYACPPATFAPVAFQLPSSSPLRGPAG